MTTAGARLWSALVLALLASVGSAAAQTPATQNPPPQTAAPPAAVQQTQTQQSENSKIPASQQSVEVLGQTGVVPPAPFVVKREESLISIPVEETTPVRRTDGVVVTLPKMEGIVSVPVRIPIQVQSQLPRYEEHPVVASSTGIKVGSVFGYRRDPFTRRARFHSGVDIKAKWGDPVGASHRGAVQFAGWYYGYGNLVIVDHGGGVTTYYAHLSSFGLEVGAKVQRGTIVGYAGSTGRATSPHLHYEMRIDGNAINPFQQVALDPSSAYFNESRPATDASGPKSASPAKIQPPID